MEVVALLRVVVVVLLALGVDLVDVEVEAGVVDLDLREEVLHVAHYPLDVHEVAAAAAVGTPPGILLFEAAAGESTLTTTLLCCCC